MDSLPNQPPTHDRGDPNTSVDISLRIISLQKFPRKRDSFDRDVSEGSIFLSLISAKLVV